ncbi:MAG: 2-oxoacid:acceptor oxidoreductase family protein [Planctomycetes bacterium]|jgi:2-oxoglutarate ferredoxin oxidoreductase subunit gamma|nr:2-oxoacid:acceptor oxidoreductase family protein [Planctomycetota bacterium]HNZ66595.1 2-oxoacid:acceptor oxidoreductase family protein [Planctomycetota bacterium]HPY75467.1 2-oxoacid:acceptor oxidoreductase family protein [Planctomycetota bacterium]HQB01365.1 2-oxoacid:acceptor oxidoreductase family protein [Planctomycetota bacterium]
MRTEIQISGFGGQGVILMGHITGRAAAIFENKNTTFTQSYGPEARGGACSAEVVISDEKISYPLLISPQTLITMSQAAYHRYRPNLDPKGILIYDSVLVTRDPSDTAHAYSIPAQNIATKLGKPIIANIVMLGFFTKITNIVSRESMEKSIEKSVPPQMFELNLEAFRQGYEYPS